MRQTILALVAIGLLFAGCAKKNAETPGQKISPPPSKPLAVPAAAPTPLDPALRDAAIQEIREAFKSTDPFIRSHAVEAVRTCPLPELMDLVPAGLEDSQPVVRFSAVMTVGELRLEKMRPKVLAMANDPDANVRVGVRFALHRLGDTRLSHDLEKTLRDTSPAVRGATAMVLGLLGEPSALKLLKHMQTDPSPAVRLQVYEAMFRLGDSAGLESLIAGTISAYPDDQQFCLLALAGMHDLRVKGHIWGGLTSDYLEVALVAARAMGMLGSEEGYGVALKGVKSVDPRQRMLAALAFGAIGRSDAQPLLAPLLKDTNPDVRLAAATAILQLKAPQKPAP